MSGRVTLPGTIPGLIRRCSPVVVGGARGVVVFEPEPEDLEHMALDLDDPTGRQHAGLWLREWSRAKMRDMMRRMMRDYASIPPDADGARYDDDALRAGIIAGLAVDAIGDAAMIRDAVLACAGMRP